MGIPADIAVVNENLMLALSAFSKVKPAGSVTQAPGMWLVRSGVDYGLFNTAVLSAPALVEGDFEQRIHRAGQYFADHHVSWSLWYCEDLLDSATRRRARIVQASNGLHMMMEAPGMLAEKLLPPVRRLPAVEIRPVTDAAVRRDFSRIMSLAFYMPLELALDVYGSEGVWTSPMTGWVAYLGARAVSTAVTFTGAGVTGVYAVGTDPKQQRHGYGEAVMRYALDQARQQHGVERSILQSSAAGFPLYARMGYRQTTRFCVSMKNNP